MGGKSKVKAPAAPDYESLIEKQAAVNRINQYTPFGSAVYSGDGKSQTVTLSPEMQGVLSQAIGRAMTGRQISAPGYDEGLDRGQIEDAIYQRQMRLVEPQFQQRERSLRQNLADRGLVEGSEAYTKALNMEMDAQNRARQDASLAAVLGGYDQYMTERNYALNRDQLLNQTDQLDFSQLASLLGATPQGGIAPIDVMGPAGLQYQGQLAEYQGKLNQQQQKKGLMSDIIGAGARIGAASMSDVRMKKNIRFVEHRNGLNWYAWDWKDGSGSSFGVIAQEVQAVKPDAVVEIDGYLHVKYGALV